LWRTSWPRSCSFSSKTTCISIKNLPIQAREVCASLGIKRVKWIAGKKWVTNFFKRHRELALRKTGKFSRARSLNFNECTHAEWYAAIKELMGLYLPEEIFNTDETGCVSNFPLWAHSHALSLFLCPSPVFPTPRGSLDIETATLKLVGQKGGFQPRQVRSVKDGHICVIMCAPVKGPPCQPLFCFAGSENERDMAKGTGEDVRWVKTANGWTDSQALFTWDHMMVAHKEKLGLAKMLIFCDNADTHMNVELNHFFSKHNIRLFGLIPSSTHATQPMDHD
jgi:DDE superfamily endonuclease